MKPYNESKKVKADFSKGNYGFHGDVVLYKESLPENFNEMDKCTDNILALGEATGHHHKLFGEGIDLRECPKTKVKYLKLVEPVELKHQEHHVVEIAPGSYRIGIQKEYDHFQEETRRVAD